MISLAVCAAVVTAESSVISLEMLSEPMLTDV